MHLPSNLGWFLLVPPPPSLPLWKSTLALPMPCQPKILTRDNQQKLFWLLLADCLLLGWIGCQPMEAPYVTIGQITSVGFFFYFAITPFLGKLEARLIQNYNVCKNLSPCKLSHIFKNSIYVVK
jgi:hypothetical protein